MKIYSIIIASVLLLASCAVARKTDAERLSAETTKKYDEQVVKRAVESRRFIVRFDRIYHPHGGFADLRPRSNYIIIDGNNAVINAAYIGRQYDFRPVAGFNVKGRTVEYEVTKKMKNGSYEVRMRVDNGANSFDVYLTIGSTGNANASVQGMRIQNARYSGHVVPIGNRAFVPEGSEII